MAEWRLAVSMAGRCWAAAGLAVLALGTAGCAPLVIGGAAAGGAAVAYTEERGISGFASDAEIQAKINNLWFQHSMDMHSRLDMTVDQGRVLLTGKAKDAQMRLDAVRLAWQADGVKEVINEIQIDNESGILDSARDTWISTQLRGRLTFDKSIHSQNFSIDTVNGVVYLMGVAKSQEELDRAINHARSVANVQRVVNYVRVIG
ncbi:BON domain-containing protein [Azospirillum sp. RWY-5-1]|uniref:BON domain-containing protein n=2 Tax=Azospirillum oleiclasticum TaxID=2735135 RepID=A0ABX2T1Q5_9PROT|nr:BON domain-containing protein [Azospirillum oleiclasticum]NYZ18178.1 BON domain-containing protein [Azospirillum oleiclasticum]